MNLLDDMTNLPSFSFNPNLNPIPNPNLNMGTKEKVPPSKDVNTNDNKQRIEQPNLDKQTDKNRTQSIVNNSQTELNDFKK